MAYVRSTRGSQAGLPQPEPHMSRAAAREPIVVVIQDGKELGDALDGICECLGITVERISSYDDLAATLRRCVSAGRWLLSQRWMPQVRMAAMYLLLLRVMISACQSC